MPRVVVLWEQQRTEQPALLPFVDLYRSVGHNTGNRAFVTAIERLFAEPPAFLPWHSDPALIADQADVVVIPCANQLGSHTDLGEMAARLDQLQLPILALGLGAQTRHADEPVLLREGTRRWVEVIAAHAAGPVNILTRGPFSHRLLESLGIGSARPACCPSLFLNPDPQLGSRLAAALERPFRRVAVAAGHQAWKEMAPVEAALAALVSDGQFPGVYITQSMADMLRISRGEAELARIPGEVLQRIIDHVRPDSSRADFADWCRRHARCFAAIDPWMEELLRHDVVVGARYHGTALGLQAGVPALCLTIDVRTAELCASSALPCLPVEQLGRIDRASLRRQIRERFDPRAFTANRAAMAERFVALLRAHGLTPSPHLEPLRLAAALPEPEPALSR